MAETTFFVHELAEVEPGASIGPGTRIWRYTHVRASASIGAHCNIGKDVYVDSHVRIGSRVKIQNAVSLFEGVTLEDGVFVGPHVCFTNDLYPRAITPNGELKSAADWQVTPTLVKYGASLGAHSVLICGITVGRFALVGAGSVVTRSVPDHVLVFGNPAQPHGYVCRCARPLADVHAHAGSLVGWCTACAQSCSIGALS